MLTNLTCDIHKYISDDLKILILTGNCQTKLLFEHFLVLFTQSFFSGIDLIIFQVECVCVEEEGHLNNFRL